MSIKDFNSFVLKDILIEGRKKKHEEYIPQELTKQRQHQYFLPHNQFDIPNPTNKTNNIDPEKWKLDTTLNHEEIGR